MTMIVCGATAVTPQECVQCGGWLHQERPGGYHPDGPTGFGYCTEDCITDYRQHVAEVAAAAHLHARDLLCDCPSVCAPAGLPSAADLAEWAAYQQEESDNGHRDPCCVRGMAT